jgi:hypothetical protein
MLLSPAPTNNPVEPADSTELRPFQIVNNLRSLYFHQGVLYCARFNEVFATTDWGEHLDPVAKLILPSRRVGWLSAHPLGQRLLRAAIYRMRVLADGTMVFVFRGGIYRRAAGAAEAHCTFSVTRGIRPVSLEVRPDGTVFFGEYWANRSREPVHIYASDDAARTWRVAYTFPAGTIRHVHGIYHDPWEECFWICTGDEDLECKLYRASLDFGRIEIAASEGQLTRFYSIHVTANRLIMATDSPLAQNYTIIFDKTTGKLEKRQAIENSSFYHCEVNSRLFISTNAEPSPSNDTHRSHIWMGDSTGESWRHCLSFPIDRYTNLSRLLGMPKGLFQYPRVFFPEGVNDSTVLVCQAIGLKGFDNAMLCFDTAGWTI